MKKGVLGIAFSTLFVIVHTGCTIGNAELPVTVTYKTLENVELKMHLFYPPNYACSGSHPAIVFFFGGGWIYGSAEQFYPQCSYFASRGMLAMSAEYRIESKHGTPPSDCVKDGKSAVRWIRQNAPRLGIDPNHIVASGGSAGGHIAAATGTLNGFNDTSDDLSVSCVPNALVLFNPVFDNSPDGYGYDRVKDYWQEFSPIHNLTNKTPPTIIFLGTEDELVPVSTAQKYKEEMEKLDLYCELHLYKNQKHGFFNAPQYRKKTLAEIDRFLVSLGYLDEKNKKSPEKR